MNHVEGTGTPQDPWSLTTPPGSSQFEAYRDPDADPPALVVQVGSTQLRYHLRCIDDLRTMLVAAELAASSTNSYPNESVEYRRARTPLLTEEIELRPHIERVAQQRRDRPPGGAVPENHVFEGPDGKVTLEDMFGDHDTLLFYSFVYGPGRAEGCPLWILLDTTPQGRGTDWYPSLRYDH